MSIERSSRLPPAPDGQRAAARRPTRTTLKRELRRLAREFADDLVELLEHHGMWEAPRDDEPNDFAAKRVRRTPAALGRVADRILSDLRGRRRPVAISAVAKGLGMTPREIAHPMSQLVAEGKVARTGERRGARYRLVSKRAVKQGSKRGGAQGAAPTATRGSTRHTATTGAKKVRAKHKAERQRRP